MRRMVERPRGSERSLGLGAEVKLATKRSNDPQSLAVVIKQFIIFLWWRSLKPKNWLKYVATDAACHSHRLQSDLLAEPYVAQDAKPRKIGKLAAVRPLPLLGNQALSGAPAFGEYRTFEADFLYGFDAGAVMLLGAQQPFPAMGQTDPKLTIVFIMSVCGELPALLGLILEEISCFEHAITTTKAPLTGAPTKEKTQQISICSEASGKRPSARLTVPQSGGRDRRLEVTGDCRAEIVQLPGERRLRLINHVSPWSGAWTLTLRTRTARSAVCRCNCGAPRQRTIWVPSSRASTVSGVAWCSMFRHARKFCNSS